MAKMTPKQLADKLRFAGEAIPSMTRRRDGHDYEARQMYLITITVEGRRPLLGCVVAILKLPKEPPMLRTPSCRLLERR